MAALALAICEARRGNSAWRRFVVDVEIGPTTGSRSRHDPRTGSNELEPVIP